MDRKVEEGSTEFKFDSSMISSGIGTDNKSWHVKCNDPKKGVAIGEAFAICCPRD